MTAPVLHLKISLPDGTHRAVPLDAGRTLRIGSHSGVEIAIAAAGVQPLHGGIVPKGDRYQLAASKSAGTILVNGVAVASAVLKAGDKISLGAARIEVVAGAPAAGGGGVDELEVLGGDDLEVLDGELEVLQTDELETLDGGGLLGLDAGAGFGPAGLGQAGLAGMSLGDPLSAGGLASGLGGGATFGGAAMAGAVPQAGAAARPPKAPGRRRPWLKGLAAVVVVALVAVVGAAVVLAMPTADERFARAEQDYQAKSYAEADQRFDDFLSGNAAHPRADEARIKRDLARLAPRLNQGGDWPAALAALRETTAAWGPLAHLGEAQAGLAEHLPRVAQGLVERAAATAEQAEGDRAEKALADARSALDLAGRLLPPGVQRKGGIDDLEVRLSALERELSRSTAVESAVAGIVAAAAAGKLDEAFDAQAALFDDYPSVADNAALRQAQRALAESARGLVSYEAVGQPAEQGETAGPFSGLPLMSRSPLPGQEADAAKPAIVVASTVQKFGAAYGLDAENGRILWRRFVGFDGDSTPVPVGSPAAGFLIYDGLRGQILRVEAATGDAVWRQAVGPCDAPPVVQGERAYLALPAGQLLEIDVGTGEIVGRFTLPQALSLPPTFDPQTGTCYQLADRGCLYALSSERRACEAAAYVGHERALVDVPPVLVAGRLMIVERDGLADARLRFFKLQGGLQPTQTLNLPGRVARLPAVADNTVWLATADGTLHAVETDAENPDRAPRFAGRIPPYRESTASPPTYLAMVSGNLWAAGDGLRRFDDPRQFSAAGPNLQTQGAYLQPPRAVAGGLLVVRAAGSGDGNPRGDAAIALLQPDGQMRWETRLAAPAAPPRLDSAQQVVWLYRADGAAFRIDAARLVESRGAVDASFSLDLAAEAAGTDAATVAVVPLSDGLAAFARPGEAAVWLHAASGLSKIPLPGPLASSPAAMKDALVVAIDGGPVCLLSLTTGVPRPAPFLPAIDFAAPPRWQGPAVTVDGASAVIAEQTTIYRLTLSAESGPRLIAAAKAALSSPLVAAPVIVGQIAWGANSAGELLAFQLADLAVVATLPLGSDLAFGPQSVGDGVVVATADGRLRFLGEAPSPQWEAELPGEIVGIAEDAGTLLAAFRDGRIAALDLGSGEFRGAILPAEPLAAGPLVVDGRLITVALDGTLLVSRQPWRESIVPPP